jgi:CRISPR-associated protein Cas5d
MSTNSTVTIKLWGKRALFTRPEFKTEQVSYDVITPTAAKGAIEAIFWKPEIRYEVTRIAVLNPIKKASIMRNMIKAKQAYKTALKGKTILIEDKIAGRTQRHSNILKNVAYLVDVEIIMKDEKEDKMKYLAMLKRRVERGQCFSQPYFGCREFPAFFALPSEKDTPNTNINQDLGMMLHSLNYQKNGHAFPLFFNALIEHGVMHIPSCTYGVE